METKCICFFAVDPLKTATTLIGSFVADLDQRHSASLQDVGQTLILKGDDLFGLYRMCEELIAYDDPEFELEKERFEIRPVTDGIAVIVNGFIIMSFKSTDLDAFRAFIGDIIEYLDDLLKDDKRYLISCATEDYIKKLQSFDIGKVIETMVSNAKMTKHFSVLPFPGAFPLDQDTTADTILGWFAPYLSKPQTRYQIGVFAISGPDGDHYQVFCLDHKNKQAVLFDSLVTTTLEGGRGFVNVIRVMWPKYEILGVDITSGSGNYEPHGVYDTQNIFCHTHALWFVFQLVYGVANGVAIEKVMRRVGTSCLSDRENLIRIKQFALWLSKTVLEEDLLHDFEYIYNPESIRQVIDVPVFERYKRHMIRPDVVFF